MAGLFVRPILLWQSGCFLRPCAIKILIMHLQNILLTSRFFAWVSMMRSPPTWCLLIILSPLPKLGMPGLHHLVRSSQVKTDVPCRPV